MSRERGVGITVSSIDELWTWDIGHDMYASALGTTKAFKSLWQTRSSLAVSEYVSP